MLRLKKDIAYYLSVYPDPAFRKYHRHKFLNTTNDRPKESYRQTYKKDTPFLLLTFMDSVANPKLNVFPIRGRLVVDIVPHTAE